MNDELRRCRRFGWTSLAAWALFGLALEAAHGFKLAAYLDDNLRHTILRLAHAHGVILALVVLAFAAASLAVRDRRRAAPAQRVARRAAAARRRAADPRRVRAGRPSRRTRAIRAGRSCWSRWAARCWSRA